MTKISRDLMKRAGIVPRLRLGMKKAGGGVMSTGPHRVKVLGDQIIKKFNREEKKEIEYVRYLVEEEGEQKTYDTRLKKKGDEKSLAYLVQRFAEVNEGDEVILEMKKAGVQNYVEVTPVGQTFKVEHEETETDDVEGDYEAMGDVIPA